MARPFEVRSDPHLAAVQTNTPRSRVKRQDEERGEPQGTGAAGARSAQRGPRWIGRSDLCQRLGISRATSYRLETAGFLPRPVRIGPRTTRWSISELEAFEQRLVEDRGPGSREREKANS
jgi:predicted DNA-binding transcriptional regulator AlpA